MAEVSGRNTHPIKWSYSSLSQFKQCPKKYYHSRVAKDIPFEETDAMRYGNYVHDAIEKYIMDGKPLPDNISQFKPVVDQLIDLPGVKTAEQKIGITLDLEPCDYWAKDVWYRGKIDYLVRCNPGELGDEHSRVLPHDAFMVDWKTGANPRYADQSELDLFAATVFISYPEIRSLHTAFVFLVTGDVIPKTYVRDDLADILLKHLPDVHRMQVAHDTDTWNATPNFTCRNYCKVSSCQYYRT